MGFGYFSINLRCRCHHLRTSRPFPRFQPWGERGLDAPSGEKQNLILLWQSGSPPPGSHSRGQLSAELPFHWTSFKSGGWKRKSKILLAGFEWICVGVVLLHSSLHHGSWSLRASLLLANSWVFTCDECAQVNGWYVEIHKSTREAELFFYYALISVSIFIGLASTSLHSHSPLVKLS